MLHFRAYDLFILVRCYPKQNRDAPWRAFKPASDLKRLKKKNRHFSLLVFLWSDTYCSTLEGVFLWMNVPKTKPGALLSRPLAGLSVGPLAGHATSLQGFQTD